MSKGADIFNAACAQIVEHGHLVATLQKRAREVSADKSRPAGNQYMHRTPVTQDFLSFGRIGDE